MDFSCEYCADDCETPYPTSQWRTRYTCATFKELACLSDCPNDYQNAIFKAYFGCACTVGSSDGKTPAVNGSILAAPGFFSFMLAMFIGVANSVFTNHQ